MLPGQQGPSRKNKRNRQWTASDGIEYKGKRILYEDFSVLLLTDVTGARYNRSVIKRLEENSKLTTHYMKAYVMMRVKGLALVVLEGFKVFTGLDVKLCDTLEADEEWLIKQ